MEILFIVIGVLLGICLSSLYVYSRFVGRIRIDRSDPDEPPYLFLELRKEVMFIANSKYVLLEVRNENFVKSDTQT